MESPLLLAMSQTEADTSVEEVIATATGIEAGEYEDDTPLGSEGLDLDSIAVIEVVEIIEMEHDISIPDEKLEELETVGDLKELVQQKLRA
ncbi:phosphopantetheine-binding protein [Halobacteriales archaeon QS_1_68_20]|nr:MAG: phosphopantetheine-binding protein [Halobacteriales archaeon QS_1_68_20]